MCCVFDEPCVCCVFDELFDELLCVFDDVFDESVSSEECKFSMNFVKFKVRDGGCGVLDDWECIRVHIRSDICDAVMLSVMLMGKRRPENEAKTES